MGATEGTSKGKRGKGLRVGKGGGNRSLWKERERKRRKGLKVGKSGGNRNNRGMGESGEIGAYGRKERGKEGRA